MQTMEGRVLFLVAIGLCAASAHLSARMPRPGDRPGPMMGGPPPVDETFSRNCTAQQEVDDDLECDGEEFLPIQCKGRHCFCVDTESGERLNSMRFRMDEDVNCTDALQCEEVMCRDVCPFGYMLDRDNCQTCRCNRAPPRQMCSTITSLVLEGSCSCECVSMQGTRGCPMCNDEPCEAVAGIIADDMCVSESDCENGTIQSVGPRGTPECVEDLPEGGSCDPRENPRPRPGPMPAGAAARMRLTELGETVTPCAEGTVCEQVGLMEGRCTMEDEQSPCVQARMEDEDIKCERDGSFRPVQCRPVNESETDEGTSRTRRSRTPREEMCRCVDPDDGSTIEGTETLVQGARDMPQCRGKMFDRCEVSGVGRGARGRRRRFRVDHGETYFDAENCRTCQCSDGNATAFCSEPGNCTVTQADSGESCTLPDGMVLAHEETRSLGCDSCGCRNGRLRCTHQRRCAPEGEERDECDQCRMRPPGPVCGPGRRNHRSRCEAVQCAGLSAPGLRNGPCQSSDVCEDYPCEDDEICIANVGVVCMGRRGCPPDQLRTCMAMEDLRCPPESEEDTEVCGTDGMTYASRCGLIQSTSGVEVEHSGPCEMEECDGMMVCGDDQVTYADVCSLRSLASASRVDYPGECVSEGATLEEICELVRSSGRCESNCTTAVAMDGCCPVCGGATTLAIDQEALDEAAQTNPALRTVDVFAGQMAASAVFADLPGRCQLESILTSTGDLQMVFPATSSEHAEFCMGKSRELEDSVRRASGTNPQVFDYVLAAAAAPIETTDETDNGAPPSMLAAPCLLLVVTLLAAIAAAF